MKETVKSTLTRIKKAFLEVEIEKIASALNSNSSEIVISALNALRRMKDSSHTAKAISLLSHFNEKVVSAALKYLKSSKRPLDKETGQLLMQRGRKVKIQLASSLDLFSHEDGCTLLKELLGEESTEIRLAALKKIGELGCEECEKILKEFTYSEDMNVRVAAIKALFEIGEPFDEELLDRVIFDSSFEENLRKRALKIRLEVSSSPEKTLEKVIENGNSALMITSFAFMEKYAFNPEKIEDMLNERSFPSNVLSSALHFLLKTRSNESKIEKIALKYHEHPYEKVRLLSFKLLDKIGSAHAQDMLSELLSSSNSSLLRSVVSYVYRYPDEENVERIERLLDNPDERIVCEALKVYRRLKLKNEIALKYLDRMYPLSLRREALKSVIEFEIVDPATLENIVKNEEDMKMKFAALEGLAKLAPERLLEVEVA